MKLLALITIGIASLGGLECIAESFRQQGYEAVVSDAGISIDSKKPVTNKQMDTLHGMRFIHSIRLVGGGFTDTGVAKMVDLEGLKSLELNSKGMTDKATVSISKLTSITRLELGGATLTPVGLSNLSQLHNLKELYLHKATIGAKALSVLKNFKGLTTLTVPGNSASPAVTNLRLSLPNVEIKATSAD